MKRHVVMALCIGAGSLIFFACDAKKETVSKGREAVKEVVTQPFNAFDSAKDSLKQSEDKNKAALEEAEKELKQ